MLVFFLLSYALVRDQPAISVASCPLHQHVFRSRRYPVLRLPLTVQTEDFRPGRPSDIVQGLNVCCDVIDTQVGTLATTYVFGRILAQLYNAILAREADLR